MNPLDELRALSKHQFPVPSAAHVLTTLGHRLAEEQANVAKVLKASLHQASGGRQRSPQRPGVNADVDQIRDSLRYRVMMEALLKREVTPRDVHFLLNTGREPRVPLGRIERGTLRLSIDDFLALSVIWRLGCEPFLKVKPERRKELAALIDRQCVVRTLRDGNAFLYFLSDRSVLVFSRREEARLGSRTLVSLCLPLADFLEHVIEITSGVHEGTRRNG